MIKGMFFTPSQTLLDRIARYSPKEDALQLDSWNVIFPFPQDALDKNPNLIQNDGY